MRTPCRNCIRHNTAHCDPDPSDYGGCCNYRAFSSAELEDYRDFNIHPLDDLEETEDE
ncbi:MAG: hypothetical protein GY750_13405 [Lentisphaerae bacterium]|nr:hypothetical protein [Lentisphaerota bacterium]MCP3966757.1 hypothetical protein [Lentisphaerota bacterium]MCP4102403.1 hypothetical protein [Lentisphaerota bacterium]